MKKFATCCTLALLTAWPAHAVPSFSATFTATGQVNFPNPTGGTPVNFSVSGAQAIASPSFSFSVADSSLAGSVQGQAGGFVSVGVGQIHALAWSDTMVSMAQSQGLVGALGNARVQAQFADSFVFSAPGVAFNAPVTVHARLRIHGILSADLSQPDDPWDSTGSQSRWASQLEIVSGGPDGFVGNWSCVLSSSNTPACGGSQPLPASGWLDVSFTLLNQQSYAVYLNTTLSSNSMAQTLLPGYQSARGGADLSHTMGWGGITGAFDSSGQALASYSLLSSDTGFDYVNTAVAVPEPGAWLLWAGGLLGMGVARRLRQVRG